MSKKWVDVDKIQSIAGRSKSYTDGKIADLASTTLDAITDLEDGKQDIIDFGDEGRELSFNREGELQAAMMRPNDNLIPYTNFANADDFYTNWNRTDTTNITIESDGNENSLGGLKHYVSFAADGRISIELSDETVKALKENLCIFSIVGVGTIDAVVSCDYTVSGGQTVLTPYLHIYDQEIPNPKTELVYSTGGIRTDLVGQVTKLTVQIDGEAGAKLYGVKLELGQIQTLGMREFGGGYRIIPQYPARVLDSGTSGCVPDPEVPNFSPGKGPGSVITYDKTGKTRLQNITANPTILKNSIFLERYNSDPFPEEWFRSSTTGIVLGASSTLGLSNRPYIRFNESGYISYDIPLTEFPFINEYFTATALIESGATMELSIRKDNSVSPLTNPFYDYIADDEAQTLTAARASEAANRITSDIISVSGSIRKTVDDLTGYFLHINISGYSGTSERSETHVLAVKLENGLDQTLAYLYNSSAGFKEMRLIPQPPKIVTDVANGGGSSTINSNLEYATKENIFAYGGVGPITILGENSTTGEKYYKGFRSLGANVVGDYYKRNAYDAGACYQISAQAGVSTSYFELVADQNYILNTNVAYLQSFPLTISVLFRCITGSVQFTTYYVNSDYEIVNLNTSDIYEASPLFRLYKFTANLPSGFIRQIGFARLNFKTDTSSVFWIDSKVELGTESTLTMEIDGKLAMREYPGRKLSDKLGEIIYNKLPYKMFGYDDNGTPKPITISPRPNLLKNANWTKISRVLINGTYYKEPYTVNASKLTDDFRLLPQTINSWSLYNGSGSGYAIVNDYGITIYNNENNDNLLLSQFFVENDIEDYVSHCNAILTIAYINDNNEIKIASIDNKKKYIYTYYTRTYMAVGDLFSFGIIYYRGSLSYDQIEIGIKPGKTVTLLAAKLEIGDTQTLGYVEDNKLILLDKWEPIVITPPIPTFESWKLYIHAGNSLTFSGRVATIYSSTNSTVLITVPTNIRPNEGNSYRPTNKYLKSNGTVKANLYANKNNGGFTSYTNVSFNNIGINYIYNGYIVLSIISLNWGDLSVGSPVILELHNEGSSEAYVYFE